MKQMMTIFVVVLIVLAVAVLTAQRSVAQSQDDVYVMLQTTQGDIQVKLFPGIAPKTVENFVGHVNNGYYNGLIFHRVIPNFMIQGGDPTGTGTGGESIWGGKFGDEINPSVTFSRPGMLAMANAGPNTNGSQFFITTVPTPWLNGKHTIFGEVVSGITVVKALESVPTAQGNKP
ncbi:MAG: peptidylprolyl isomerase, partial [Candidatus Omnitrophica bacterium]|nr:peptidylprolyl isomerase [Candidatus Omnitrophota bacterium]